MPKTVCVRRSDVQPFASGDLQILNYQARCETSASVALIQVKPGASHGQARSTRSDRYCYVLGGLVEFEVGQIVYWLAQGDLLIVPRGEWFDFRNHGPEPATLLVLHTPPFRLESEEFASEKE
jgi:mannose-6-phosphate isomerase-like protein (cupin superfamily)